MLVKGRFTEPTLELDVTPKDAHGHFTVRLALHGEPAMIGEHFEVEYEVERTQLLEFSRALKRQLREVGGVLQ